MELLIPSGNAISSDFDVSSVEATKNAADEFFNAVTENRNPTTCLYPLCQSARNCRDHEPVVDITGGSGLIGLKECEHYVRNNLDKPRTVLFNIAGYARRGANASERVSSGH